mmetsp:Transcript_17220/g.47430  ORF Transcript_17220/g.47430 Transcript_17220/m.47430 type:complete len:210 (+) Transcript_17220:1488-2117(+)
MAHTEEFLRCALWAAELQARGIHKGFVAYQAVPNRVGDEKSIQEAKVVFEGLQFFVLGRRPVLHFVLLLFFFVVVVVRIRWRPKNGETTKDEAIQGERKNSKVADSGEKKSQRVAFRHGQIDGFLGKGDGKGLKLCFPGSFGGGYATGQSFPGSIQWQCKTRRVSQLFGNSQQVLQTVANLATVVLVVVVIVVLFFVVAHIFPIVLFTL